LLLDEGYVTRKDLFKLVEIYGVLPENAEDYILKHGIISEREFAKALAEYTGYEYIDLSNFKVKDEVFFSVNIDLIERHRVLPLNFDNNGYEVAISDPRKIETLDEIFKTLGKDVKIRVGNAKDIDRLINTVLETSLDSEVLLKDLDLNSIEEYSELIQTETLKLDEGPILKLLNTILIKAIRKRASDIHFEVYEHILKIKYRIDGVLFTIAELPASLKDLLITRIKVMADLDIAEKRIPQDGRFYFSVFERRVDFRVSVLPSIYGETVVLRILDKESGHLNLTKLGFLREDLIKFRKCILKPYGMILIAGPTGSGKTTTLYSAIKEIHKPYDKFITIEDPVEYQFPDIVQIAVNEKKGLTFANGLRSIVRQDPDKIMIGEIRDFETAQIAIQAALTGHLVLSSIHANNTVDAIQRLINMGVDSYQFVSSFLMIVSQRLVRKLCNSCKIPDEETFELVKIYMDDAAEYEGYTFYTAPGCRFCQQTGFQGRIGIFEVMLMTDTIKELILKGESPLKIRKVAINEGMKTLRMAAWQAAISGITSIEEINRVTFEESLTAR